MPSLVVTYCRVMCLCISCVEGRDVSKLPTMPRMLTHNSQNVDRTTEGSKSWDKWCLRSPCSSDSRTLGNEIMWEKNLPKCIAKHHIYSSFFLYSGTCLPSGQTFCPSQISQWETISPSYCVLVAGLGLFRRLFPPSMNVLRISVRWCDAYKRNKIMDS